MKKIVFSTLLALTAVNVSAQNEIIYHVFQRSFFDSNGDGHGDLKGINQKLDYLNQLGVNVIMLTPLYQSDFYHNYFATDFEKIDPKYGAIRDYSDLIREAHRRKMKVYMDVEMQYVTDKHPWFTDSYKNPASKYSEYIYYKDDKNNEPYYFLDVPEFTTYNDSKEKIIVVNMKSAKVKEYTYNVLKYWIDPNGDGDFKDGIDGFRLDHMMDDLDNAGKLTNLFKNFWTPLLDNLRKINPDIKIVAEQADWASFGHEYLTKGNVDMVFAFRLKYAISTFKKEEIIKAADSTFLNLPEGKRQVVFIENHDTKRFASEPDMNSGKLRVGAALNILIGGIPSIYYGQELGMKGEQMKGTTDGNDIPIREAYEWYAAEEGKGMALWYKDTGPWWDNRNMKPNDGISVEEQEKDKTSLLNYYRELLRLKRLHPALAGGTYKNVANSNDNVFSFLRTHDKETILVMVNLSGSQQFITVTDGSVKVNKLQLISGQPDASFPKGGRSINLVPYGIQVWRFL